MLRLALLGCLLLTACAGVPVPREKLGDVAGALLFNGYLKPDVTCYRCHNGEGHGTWRGPDLAQKVLGVDDARLTSSIRDGKGWGMPSYKDTLNDLEIGQLLAWLRTVPPAPKQP